MEEFPGKKANSRIYLYNGYIYHRDVRCHYIYRCSKRRNFKCQGRLEQEGETHVLISVHDHPPDVTSSDVLKMKKEMKEMCKNKYISNKEIFDNVSRRYPEAAVSLSYNTVRTPLYREKIKYRPSLPTNLLGLRTKLETYEPLKNIYKGEVTSIHGEIALIFSTDELLKELASCTEMFLDGTFSVVPNVPKIAQLYSIHIRYFQTAIATVFILFESRTKSLYDAVWVKIKELVPDLEKNVQFIMLDYEHAAGASVSEHFPSTSIHGCWFHYNQAIFRKWKSLNLSNVPRDVLSMAMTLPLAPPEYFSEGYKIIEEQADTIERPSDTIERHSDIYLFLVYLRCNWINAASKVSVYKCRARTNNIVESFHNMAVKKFSAKHPNLWIFLEKLSDLLMDEELDLGRAKRGLRVRRICSRLQRQKDLRIVELQEALITGKISLKQFLKMFDNEHECQRYSMQMSICDDNNNYNNDNNDNINLEHFTELQIDKENIAADQTSSGQQINVLARGRGRGRRRTRRNPIPVQRPLHVSPETSNSERCTSEQINTPTNLEAYEQSSGPMSREDFLHISYENISQISDGISAAPQDILLSNSSDEDIYRIPSDDYSILSEKSDEDIPFHPVQQSSDTSVRAPDCCSICLVEKANHAFVPCGHLCCCASCILELQSKKCPICNVDYNSYMKVICP